MLVSFSRQNMDLLKLIANPANDRDAPKVPVGGGVIRGGAIIWQNDRFSLLLPLVPRTPSRQATLAILNSAAQVTFLHSLGRGQFCCILSKPRATVRTLH